jgi:hypothetical protein
MPVVDGKAVTTARFERAGTYQLVASASDRAMTTRVPLRLPCTHPPSRSHSRKRPANPATGLSHGYGVPRTWRTTREQMAAISKRSVALRVLPSGYNEPMPGSVIR